NSLAPANDLFANRIALTGASVNTTGTNQYGTKETGEPAIAGAPGGKSVWWAWTAPASGSTTISLIGSSFDTLLGVYTGTAVNALTLVASNDDFGGTTQSQVTITATAGVIYIIDADGYGGVSGSLKLTVTQATSNAAPTVATAASATPVTSTGTTTTLSVLGA